MGGVRRRVGVMRAGTAVLAMTAVATIAACSIASGPERTGDVTDRVRQIDLLPRFPQPVEPQSSGGGEGTRATSVYGAEAKSQFGAESKPLAPGQRTSNGGEGYELNFENTPVTTVAKVVLGDILGLGYTIDPRVQGTVSLASGRPVPKSDILFVLENALRVSHVVMVRDARGDRLIHGDEAVGAGTIDREAASAEPGYGVSVVPLRHVSAATLIKLLDSFAMKAGAVRADSARNMLLIQGTGPERQNAIETVL